MNIGISAAADYVTRGARIEMGRLGVIFAFRP